MITDLEMGCLSGIAGFATGFALEWRKMSEREFYDIVTKFFVLLVIILMVTWHAREFLIITIPFMVAHKLARWLFGPP